ncbi:coat protein [Lactococcus lactis]|uniref:major capsid protein n=1 Tax=Lactococcus lactis TaxID=1358 RepID=UPI00223C0787|nr:major capsid protein [Lactococcus lactis]MCT1186494.1 coat protein [Lactococcus lactis]MCT1189560.1 coat protein [Lactococcus lactis]
MSTELTRILDTIKPEIFNAYMQEFTAEKSAFVQSGIAVADERVSKNITAGGLLVKMPYWTDISGDDEVVGDGDKSLSTGKITVAQDTAAVHYRGRGWSVNEMAAVVSGDDPMKALLSRIATWWVRREQQILISSLNGMFAAGGALTATHSLDRSTKNIDAKLLLDTKQLLGDAAERVNTLAMHSAVYTDLQKQQLITFIPNARGEVNIPTYLGYRVVVDDGIKADKTGVYTTYLFGTGSIGRNSGNPSDLTTFETDREAATGTDKIYTRRAITMHPYGVKWTDAERDPGNITPTNADLEKAANWKLVYEPKNVAILALKHKIGLMP